MPFQFRFARVKSIRELEEDLAQQRLALARQEEERQAAKLRVAQEQEQLAYAGYASPRSLAAISLELELRNCHDLANQTLRQTQVREQAVRQVEEDRRDLMVRMQKVKILQNLHDRHQEVYHIEELTAEQKVLDEVGSIQQQRLLKHETRS